MINKPQYIIVAGINGAGKSTLYDTLPIFFDKTKRINADEILNKFVLKWFNGLVKNIMANEKYKH